MEYAVGRSGFSPVSAKGIISIPVRVAANCIGERHHTEIEAGRRFGWDGKWLGRLGFVIGTAAATGKPDSRIVVATKSHAPEFT